MREIEENVVSVTGRIFDNLIHYTLQIVAPGIDRTFDNMDIEHFFIRFFREVHFTGIPGILRGLVLRY